MRQAEKITFVSSTGESVEFSPSSDYFWKDQEGIGGLSGDIFTSESIGRDGVTIKGKKLGAREITIFGQIKADYAAARAELLRILKPNQCGRLVYENETITRSIPCVIQAAPDPRPGVYPEFDVEFFCASPFWRGGDGTTQNVASIARWINNLVFPVVFVEEGIVFGYRSPSLVTNLVNTGDKELPLVIEISITAACSDPKITNIQTQEYLLVEGDFLAGDLIQVNTDDDAMTAILIRSGVETNIINSVTEESTWLRLNVGDNYLRAEASVDDNAEVRLYFDDMRYVGV